jgi:glycosyltransferase involved in cell wall biosynthesis
MQNRSVLINARFLDQPLTGVQRYAIELCHAIDDLIAQRDAATAGMTFSAARPIDARAPFPYRQIQAISFGRFDGYRWEQFELPWHGKYDLLVNLCNLCPLLGRRNLTVVHDANVWLMPENYSFAFRSTYRFLVPLGIRSSKAWVTVTRYSADQLLTRRIADRPPNAIIANGVGHIIAASSDGPTGLPSDLPSCFVFALGSQSRNKNTALVRSLATALAGKGISIVIAGDAQSKVFTNEASDHPTNLIELGRVSDQALAYLFRNCLCFVFPSFYEGFGIPPLEAMALGAPVISSGTSSLPEVLGDAALYCSPGDPGAWIQAITKLRGDNDLRANLVSRGAKQAAKYDWRVSAERLLKLIRQVLDGG